jgi:hypothetical protein
MASSVTGMDIDWTAELADQLEWHWKHQLRPRLDGLTDAEYFWEPVPGCWSVRRRGAGSAPQAVGTGDFLFEYAYPAPDPAPVTTIAWRLAHITVACLAERNAIHFGRPPADHRSFAHAGTAAEALRQLDEEYATWVGGIRKLDDAALAKPIGPAHGQWAEHPMAGLILHNHRELIHHGAEISLLRDLYQAKGDNHGL